LRTQYSNFGFCKMQGISWLAGELLASGERLYSMELVALEVLILYQFI
jgi:hypothetical protein